MQTFSVIPINFIISRNRIWHAGILCTILRRFKPATCRYLVWMLTMLLHWFQTQLKCTDFAATYQLTVTSYQGPLTQMSENKLLFGKKIAIAHNLSYAHTCRPVYYVHNTSHPLTFAFISISISSFFPLFLYKWLTAPVAVISTCVVLAFTHTLELVLFVTSVRVSVTHAPTANRYVFYGVKVL